MFRRLKLQDDTRSPGPAKAQYRVNDSDHFEIWNHPSSGQLLVTPYYLVAMWCAYYYPKLNEPHRMTVPHDTEGNHILNIFPRHFWDQEPTEVAFSTSPCATPKPSE